MTTHLSCRCSRRFRSNGPESINPDGTVDYNFVLRFDHPVFTEFWMEVNIAGTTLEGRIASMRVLTYNGRLPRLMKPQTNYSTPTGVVGVTKLWELMKKSHLTPEQIAERLQLHIPPSMSKETLYTHSIDHVDLSQFGYTFYVSSWVPKQPLFPHDLVKTNVQKPNCPECILRLEEKRKQQNVWVDIHDSGSAFSLHFRHSEVPTFTLDLLFDFTIMMGQEQE